MSSEKKTAGSGEHRIVLEFRKKLESIADTQLKELEGLNARLTKMVTASSPPPPKRDPRREPDDNETTADDAENKDETA